MVVLVKQCHTCCAVLCITASVCLACPQMRPVTSNTALPSMCVCMQHSFPTRQAPQVLHVKLCTMHRPENTDGCARTNICESYIKQSCL